MRDSKYTTKTLVILAISLCFMFILGSFLPTWGPVQRMGVKAICIFIGAIIMFANAKQFGMVVPSFLTMLAIIVTGHTTGTKIIQDTLGSATVWQLLIIFVVLYALTECGADAVLARWMISRKSLNGKPVLFTLVFFLATLVLGALASALGAFLFSTAMINSIGDECGYEKDCQWRKAMYTGAIVISSIGGGILPFKGMALMIFNLVKPGLEESGVAIDQVSYMIAAIVAGLITCVLMAVAMKPLFKTDFEKMKHVDLAEITSRGGTKFNKRQIVTLLLFILGIAHAIVLIFMDTTAGVGALLNNIGQGMWFCFICAIYHLVHIDGEPILNVERAMTKAVNWGIVMSVCAFTALGMMVSSNDYGVKTWLSDIMNSLFGNMPFAVFVFVMVLLTLVLTNVFSNTATAVIIGTLVGPFFIKYGTTLGINVSCLIPAIVMSALCAFLTMGAGGSAPLYLGSDVMKDSPKWTFTYGLWIFPIMTIGTGIAYILCAYIL